MFTYEFRARLKSVAVWSLSIASLILVFFSIYGSFAKDAALLDQLMARFPPELKSAFGLTNTNMASVLGYYALIFLFVQLCLAIEAASYGFALVSTEENELTADFLLTKPVSRTQVMTSKLLAALAALTVTNAVVWASTWLAMAVFRDGHEYEPGTLALLLLSVAIFQLFFLAVGLVISLLVRRVRSVTPYALGLAFGAYVLSAFSGVLGDVKLEILTPFKHFDGNRIVATGSLDTPLVALNVAVSLIAIAASYWLYVRRDIKAVS
jgi:ABC-2 type transport system permease protein